MNHQPKIKGKWLPKIKPVFVLKYKGKYVKRSPYWGGIPVVDLIQDAQIYSYRTIDTHWKRYFPELFDEMEVILVGFTS